MVFECHPQKKGTGEFQPEEIFQPEEVEGREEKCDADFQDSFARIAGGLDHQPEGEEVEAEENPKIGVDDRQRRLTKAGVDQKEKNDESVLCFLFVPEGLEESKESEGGEPARKEIENLPSEGVDADQGGEESFPIGAEGTIDRDLGENTFHAEMGARPSISPIIPIKALLGDKVTVGEEDDDPKKEGGGESFDLRLEGFLLGHVTP